VARQFGEAGVSCQIASNVSDAIARARTYVNIDEGNYVYIAGSLYLIGEVRGLLL